MPELIPQPGGRGMMNRWLPGESGNPKGRPVKTLTGVLNELKAAGFQRVTVEGVYEAYELLMGLSEDQLKDTVSDKKQPMIMRIVGRAMLEKKGADMLERMLDRAHGKPKQSLDHTTNGKDLPTPIMTIEEPKKD